MSTHPKKALLSKLYEKQLEKQRIEFEREREVPPPYPPKVYERVVLVGKKELAKE